jgi:hypothetical protein
VRPPPYHPGIGTRWLIDLHSAWAWVVIVGNALAGLWALAAHWWERFRHPALWWFTIAAEVAIVVQGVLGATASVVHDVQAPSFHAFYGYVAIIAVAILYSYRSSSEWVRQRLYLVYGLGGLFLMGLGIRALLLR